MFDDDISAAFVREATDLGGPVWLRRVHHVVGAQRPRGVQLLLLPGGCNHARAVQSGHLDRGLSDAAPGRHHQHRLPLAHVGAGHQHVPGGEERQRKGRAISEGNLRRQRDEVARGHRRELRIAALALVADDAVGGAEAVLPVEAGRAVTAVQPGMDDHARAGRQPALAGVEQPRPRCRCRECAAAAASRARARAAARGPDDSVRTRGRAPGPALDRRRIGHLEELQHLGPAVVCDWNCAHMSSVEVRRRAERGASARTFGPPDRLSASRLR